MDLQLRIWVENKVHEKEAHWLSGKEKVPGVAVNKEGHAACFWDMKGPMTIDFLERGTTVNIASYCNFLRLVTMREKQTKRPFVIRDRLSP